MDNCRHLIIIEMYSLDYYLSIFMILIRSPFEDSEFGAPVPAADGHCTVSQTAVWSGSCTPGRDFSFFRDRLRVTINRNPSSHSARTSSAVCAHFVDQTRGCRGSQKHAVANINIEIGARDCV